MYISGVHMKFKRLYFIVFTIFWLCAAAGSLISLQILLFVQHCWSKTMGSFPETLAETVESGPLCITDLFQNKSVAYF